MAAVFLLLELTDPTINAFLWSIRRILTGRHGQGRIHVTLRGPYEGKPSSTVLNKARAALKYDVLRIADVGRFSNADGEVVFLRVDSPHLRSVWWKPTFPIERFGFEPHISIYRGRDAEFANSAAEFIATERLELNCAEHRLTWHCPREPGLFRRREPTVGELSNLQESGRIDPAFLNRLEEFVDGYRGRRCPGNR